jgi:hypothetical protein
MWESQRLTSLWASTAYYTDSFTFYVKYRVLYELDDLRLIISAHYSLQMALKVRIDSSFSNIQVCKEYGRKDGKLMVRKL